MDIFKGKNVRPILSSPPLFLLFHYY